MARAVRPRAAKVTLGSRLCQLREQAGLSLRSVATAAKISAPYLSTLERDRGTPSDQVVFDLSTVLNCEADELLAILGRIADDLKEIILTQPTEWAGIIMTGSDFPVKDLGDVRAFIDKRRKKLGLPDMPCSKPGK
jgi:transcriptional regulator with XRE-family HTH domain